MKKWLIISSVALLVIIGCVAGAYIKAMEPKKDASAAAFKKAKEESDIITMDEFYLYHGLDAYSVVIGETKDGEKMVVWIPEDKHLKTVTNKYSEGKTKKEIEKMATEQLNPEKIISIKLGMEKNIPLWEVTYLDSENLYNYDYFDFKTGEWIKYYRSI